MLKNFNMKILLLLFISIFAFNSCNTEPKEIIVKKERVKTTKKSQKVIPNKSLKVKVSGMMCEMGCGGSIRTELKAGGGIDRVIYDFKDGEKEQFTEIRYDDRLTDQSKIVNLIEAIQEGKFKVTQVIENSNFSI